MKMLIIALCTTVSFLGGIITHYGTTLENGAWTLCGIILFFIGTLVAMLVDDLGVTE